MFYDDVHECEDMCDADKHCVGFVHNLNAERKCERHSSEAACQRLATVTH